MAGRPFSHRFYSERHSNYKDNPDYQHYNHYSQQLIYTLADAIHAENRRRKDMANYQTKLIPAMPRPSQRLGETRVADRRPRSGYGARRNTNNGINAILAYFD